MLSPTKFSTLNIGTLEDIQNFLFIIIRLVVFSLTIDYFGYLCLTDYLRAPETGQLSGVQGTSISDLNASFNNTTVLSMETLTTQDNGVDGVAITTHSTTAIVTIDRSNGCPVVAGRKYAFIFDNDRSDSFFDASSSDF
jgi:hypothetical protein